MSKVVIRDQARFQTEPERLRRTGVLTWDQPLIFCVTLVSHLPLRDFIFLLQKLQGWTKTITEDLTCYNIVNFLLILRPGILVRTLTSRFCSTPGSFITA